ncbi:MAG: ParB/RepB/Spo0J family partition protein [Candidatus Limnocylindrales bacterium]
MARTDFRAAAARRLSEERELGPAVISLLSPEGASRTLGVRHVPVSRIEANPDQPRITFEQSALDELTASIREHGILQPVLLRPFGGVGRYQLIAGERRWRAAKAAGLDSIPAMIEEIDDDTALEIAIIENLQREDLSPLEEATMYDRMVKDHGYSIRRLAQKLGKDKGYLENRLRLADAPEEIRQLVSLRKDTLSHAYELMKVEDPKKRRRLAAQVASGELSLVKLKLKIEGRRARADEVGQGTPEDSTDDDALETAPAGRRSRNADPATDLADPAGTAWSGARPVAPLREDSLLEAKQGLADSLEELFGVLRQKDVLDSIGEIDRSNLAKYLMIAKLRLENAIAMVRSGEIN